MRKLIISSIVLGVLTPSLIHANEINPFLTPEAREKKVEESREREKEMLKALMEEILGSGESVSRSAGNELDGQVRGTGVNSTERLANNIASAGNELSSLAVIGFKDKNIMLRLDNNRVIFLESGDHFHLGEAQYSATLRGDAVIIHHTGTNKIVFEGGAGSYHEAEVRGNPQAGQGGQRFRE